MKTIVIGVGENKNIVEAAKKIGAKNKEINFIFTSSEKELLTLFLEKKADSYVRGSLSASSVMKHLKSCSSKEENNYEITENDKVFENSSCINQEFANNGNANGEKINRASFIKLYDNCFLLAPVGIDEGQNIEDKMIIVDQACEFLKKTSFILLSRMANSSPPSLDTVSESRTVSFRRLATSCRARSPVG